MDINKYNIDELKDIGNIISTLFLAEIVKKKDINILSNEIDKLIIKKEDKDNIEKLIKFILKIYKKDKEIDYNKLQELLNNKMRSGSMLVENVLEFEREAREKGFNEGIEKGIEKSKIEFVKNMYKKSFDISVIADITNLTEERIKEIIKSK